MNLTKTYFSPAKLFVITWSFALVAAYLGSANEVYRRYDVIELTFTLEGVLWIYAAIGVFVLGTVAANRRLLVIQLPLTGQYVPRDDREDWESWKLVIGSILAYIIGVGIVFLLVYWTLLAVREVGSLTAFVETMYQSWHSMRRLWPAQKPFTGARLLYTGLISIVIIGASGMALTNQDRQHLDGKGLYRSHRYWILLVLVGLLPLMMLPLLVSQRILLATALVGAITTYVMLSSRGIPVLYPVVGFIAGFGVWTAQEVVRAGFTSGTVFGSLVTGVERLLFYFTNNVGNLNRGVSFSTERSYGFESFGFIFEYLFISDTVRNLYFESFYSGLASYKAGGGFTALGVPYLDFGVFGLIIIFVWGYVSQAAYLTANRNVFGAQVYGLIAASIVLSWHTAIWTDPYFWFNIAFLVIFILIAPAVQLTRYRSRSDETNRHDAL